MCRSYSNKTARKGMESQIEFYKKQCLVPYVTIITTMVFCDELEKLKDFALVYSLK